MNKQAETGGTVMNFGQAVKLLKFGAPLHPILVHFTIALVSASLLFDAVSFFFNVSSLLVGQVLDYSGLKQRYHRHRAHSQKR